MGIREKLKASQVRLVELASYLDVSRPTLYRYLELYEQKEYNEIDKRCYDLFSFIDKTRNLTRPIMMDYLINKILPIEANNEYDVETIASVRKLAQSQSEIDMKKIRLIRALSMTNQLDCILDNMLQGLLDSSKNNQMNENEVYEEK